MIRLKKAWFAVALVAALSSCRCSTKPTRNAEEFVPRDAAFLVSVPKVGALADKAQLFLGSVRGGPGGAELVAMSANLARQLGFDPFTRAGLEAAGIETEASAALGGVAFGRGGVSALPMRDQDKLEATLQRLAKDRAGAGIVEGREQDGVKVTVLAKAAGGAPVIAYAAKDGFLVFAAGADAIASVAAATKRTAADSIATEAGYSSARQKVGAREAYVFAPNRDASANPLLPETAVVGVGLGDKELSLRAYVALPAATRAFAAPLLAGGGDALLAMLPAQAPIYARGGVDLTSLMKALEQDETAKTNVAQAREAAREVEIDFDADVIGNIAPGFAVSLGLSPTANVAQALSGAGAVNPFETVTLFALGEVKDAERGLKTLEKIAQVAERGGVEVTTRELAGAHLMTARVGDVETVTVGLWDKRIVVTAGYGDKLEALLANVQAKKGLLEKQGFAPRAQEALFRAEGDAFVLDFAKVNEAIGKLPDSAFGTGPAAFMARSAATGLLKQLARVRLVAAAAATEGGVMVDLSASIQ